MLLTVSIVDDKEIRNPEASVCYFTGALERPVGMPAVQRRLFEGDTRHRYLPGIPFQRS